MRLTLMLCGPHERREWSPLYHRVHAARDVAGATRTSVLVCGDSFEGRAARHFAELLDSWGVPATEAFDPGGRTLTDARAGLRAIRDRAEFADVTDLFVVTDDWHAKRALTMLRGERTKILPGRDLAFHDASVDYGPRVAEEILEGERRGILDYLAGRPYRPFGDPFGKPCHPTEERCHE